MARQQTIDQSPDDNVVQIGGTTIVIKNQGEGTTRNLPIHPQLAIAVAKRVEEAYGPGYTATLMSGGHAPKGRGNIFGNYEARGTTGSARHNVGETGSLAGDFVIESPDGKVLAGADLDPLANVWIGVEGSMGINQKQFTAGNGGSMTHLDLVGGFNPAGRDLQGPESNHWYYNKSAAKYRFNEEARANRVVKALGFNTVEEYQAARGLEADGVIGPNTLAKVSADIGKLPNVAVAVLGSEVRNPIQLSQTDRDAAIRTIIGEAIGGGAEAQEAVAHVIANRFDEGYGPSVAAIATDPNQFDAWNHDLVTAYAPGSPEYEAAAQIVDQVFGRATGVRPPDPTDGSTFFYSGEKQPSFWSRGIEKVASIGGNIFGKAKAGFARPQGFALRQTRGDESDPRTAMLQQQLSRVGLYKGEVDGRYGPQTAAAVRQWQESNGMRATGTADGPTLKSLKLPTTTVGFEKRLMAVNPESPANRSRLFPDDQPMSPKDQAIADILEFDPVAGLGATRGLTGGAAGDRELKPEQGTQTGDRTMSQRNAAARMNNQVGDRTMDQRLDPAFSAVLDKVEAGMPLNDADNAVIEAWREQGGEPNEPIVQRANRLLGPHPNEAAAAAADRRPTPPTPPARPARAAPEASVGGIRHKVKSGDTFGKLAKQYLGDAARYPEIEQANPGVDARRIPIGAELVIPGTTEPPSPPPRPSTAVDIFGGTDRTGLSAAQSAAAPAVAAPPIPGVADQIKAPVGAPTPPTAVERARQKLGAGGPVIPVSPEEIATDRLADQSRLENAAKLAAGARIGAGGNAETQLSLDTPSFAPAGAGAEPEPIDIPTRSPIEAFQPQASPPPARTAEQMFPAGVTPSPDQPDSILPSVVDENAVAAELAANADRMAGLPPMNDAAFDDIPPGSGPLADTAPARWAREQIFGPGSFFAPDIRKSTPETNVGDMSGEFTDLQTYGDPLSLDAMPAQDEFVRPSTETLPKLPPAGAPEPEPIAPPPVAVAPEEEESLFNQVMTDVGDWMYPTPPPPATGGVAVSQVKGDVENAPTQSTGGEFMTGPKVEYEERGLPTVSFDGGGLRSRAIITEQGTTYETLPFEDSAPEISLDAMPGSDTSFAPVQDATSTDAFAALDLGGALPFAEVAANEGSLADKTNAGAIPDRPSEVPAPGTVPATDDNESVVPEDLPPADPVAAIEAAQRAPASGPATGASATTTPSGSVPSAVSSGGGLQASASRASSGPAAFTPRTSGVGPAGPYVAGYNDQGRNVIQTNTWTAVENPDGTYSHSFP